MNRPQKIAVVALVTIAAIGLLGARRGTRAPVELGRSYVIQTYPAPIDGKVVDVLGNGWWTLQKADGTEVDVNVMHAFSIIEKK